MSAHGVAGRTGAFAALAPIAPARERDLRTLLASLDRDDSPLGQVAGTHFARWLVISEFHYKGPPQKRDVLLSSYLLFSACFDGVRRDDFLVRLQAGLGAAADAVWGHCVGYGGLADLPRYLCHNEIALSVLFAQFPEASVADIQGALNVRARLLAFAKKHQGTRDVGDLRQAWTAEFGRVGPRATGG